MTQRVNRGVSLYQRLLKKREAMGPSRAVLYCQYTWELNTVLIMLHSPVSILPYTFQGDGAMGLCCRCEKERLASQSGIPGWDTSPPSPWPPRSMDISINSSGICLTRSVGA